MGCKAFKPHFITTFTHRSASGSDGRIASSTTSVIAFQGVSGMLWTTYQRHLMEHMNARCGNSKARTGNLPNGCSYALRRLNGHSESRNWQNSWHSISRQDKYRHSTRIGAWKIRWKPWYLRAPRCLSLSMPMIPESYNFRTTRSRSF